MSHGSLHQTHESNKQQCTETCTEQRFHKTREKHRVFLSRVEISPCCTFHGEEMRKTKAHRLVFQSHAASRFQHTPYQQCDSGRREHRTEISTTKEVSTETEYGRESILKSFTIPEGIEKKIPDSLIPKGKHKA